MGKNELMQFVENLVERKEFPEFKAGDTITYGGKSYGVVSTSMDESSTGAATFAIEGTAPDSAAIHTYPSSASV